MTETRPAPTPADIDNIHHALGRPKHTYTISRRNYFCTETGGELATRFETLGLWKLERTINSGRDAIYSVNTAGKVALVEAIKAGWKEYDR